METAIKISAITKQYKRICALNNLSLEIPKGKVYGLLGENGAGKTTLMRSVTGLIRPDSGQITVFNEKVNHKNPVFLRYIGAIVESPGLYGNLTAKDNVIISAKMHNCDISDAQALLKDVGLENTNNKRVKFFSSGMKQRLGIACSLVHSPQILILDEPTIGLDPQGVIDLRNLIKKLVSDREMTVIISSHILSEIVKIADVVGIIHKGMLIEQFNMVNFAGDDSYQTVSERLEQKFLSTVSG